MKSAVLLPLIACCALAQIPTPESVLGHKPGDMVIVSTPGGVKEYTILSVD